MADLGDMLHLQKTWCKGGRERYVPITNEHQRQVLDKAKRMFNDVKRSLVPTCFSYKRQRINYDDQVKKAGLKKLHGLRHAYAQQRYKELTGWDAPLAGGPSKKELTIEQRRQDYRVRLTISEELGHSREQITATYLGR